MSFHTGDAKTLVAAHPCVGCLYSPDLSLNAWRIPRELLVARLCGHPGEVGSESGAGMLEQPNRWISQRE